MKKLKAFAVHGAAVGSDKSIKLDEISILADPETLKDLGVFFDQRIVRNGKKWNRTFAPAGFDREFFAQKACGSHCAQPRSDKARKK